MNGEENSWNNGILEFSNEETVKWRNIGKMEEEEYQYGLNTEKLKKRNRN